MSLCHESLYNCLTGSIQGRSKWTSLAVTEVFPRLIKRSKQLQRSCHRPLIARHGRRDRRRSQTFIQRQGNQHRLHILYTKDVVSSVVARFKELFTASRREWKHNLLGISVFFLSSFIGPSRSDDRFLYCLFPPLSTCSSDGT